MNMIIRQHTSWIQKTILKQGQLGSQQLVWDNKLQVGKFYTMSRYEA